ncbi:MAG: MarR family transcriptional regulator [Thermoleophilia bacterium]|nr:MarR family transcriptional regulator [Thermoleophilia bacterium]
MKLNAVAVVEAADAAPAPTDATPTMAQISESIWRLTEEVLELLRTRATGEVQKQKKPDVLWVDDVTRAQGNTVIAIRQLCEATPEGVTLKKLAEAIEVTPAAASVMVELLVKKKMLKRTRSKSDRRSILIRLAPETSQLFEISEQTLGDSVMSLADALGPDLLRQWQKILATAAVALRQVVGTHAPAEGEDSEPPLAEGE